MSRGYVYKVNARTGLCDLWRKWTKDEELFLKSEHDKNWIA